MTLPATLHDPAVVRTHTPLRQPECQWLKQHAVVWYGIGLCCWPNMINDDQPAPVKR